MEEILNLKEGEIIEIDVPTRILGIKGVTTGHFRNKGKMHYTLYEKVLPNVAKHVVKKLDPVGTKANKTVSYETIKHTPEVTYEGTTATIEGIPFPTETGADVVRMLEETENVFTIHITPAMKEKIAQQGGLSPYGYAHGGLVQQTLNRRRNKNLDRL